MGLLRKRRYAMAALIAVSSCAAALTIATALAMRPLPVDLRSHVHAGAAHRFLDRHGKPLNVSYGDAWNVHDEVVIHDVAPLQQAAFVAAEDKRFFAHRGVDWAARAQALVDNLRAGRVVRGASTITEQVVRMLHPRTRSPWSRWVEGFEALALERQHTKYAILEFYLNQVPYTARRRGIVQAARYYFDRDLSTLNATEMLTLAVLVRAPRWLDPRTQDTRLRRALADLAARLDPGEPVEGTALEVRRRGSRTDERRYNTAHFLAFINRQATTLNAGVTRTSLDLEVQYSVQQIIDARLHHLRDRHVHNAAALVVDHESNAVRAWVVGHAGGQDKPFNAFDAVTVQRQSGSTLKPLLYAAALDRGWTAATLLDDTPLEESVGPGMHVYHNYSRVHYGPVPLREALGNSLNIPAVRAVQFVGPARFLAWLRDFGITSLSAHANVYGDGLALGNGEVSLYELVQAYTVLARMGDFTPLSVLDEPPSRAAAYRIISEDLASLIADVLSDPLAREKEFGRYSVLDFPYQTAVKTGTSSDYRDAIAIGFNDKYTVGVWFGNMDYTEMNGVTGSTGPALALRAIFNELNRNRRVRPLYFSDKLVRQAVCADSGRAADGHCEARDEWFVAGTGPAAPRANTADLRLRKPGKGLLLAMDPRIPDDLEYFEFALGEIDGIESVDWYVNDTLVGTTGSPRYAWKLARGAHAAYAKIKLRDRPETVKTDVVTYRVH